MVQSIIIIVLALAAFVVCVYALAAISLTVEYFLKKIKNKSPAVAEAPHELTRLVTIA